MTTMMQPKLTTLRDLIAAEIPSLIKIRHDLHAHPELGYEEKRTSEVVQRELKNAGIDFKPGLAGGTGVLGHIPSGNGQSKAIGLRADMDALPIKEQTNLPYASTIPGKMHACGHDGHTTILIGVARVLAKLAKQSPLPKPVTFFFQPAEEGGAGAQKMIEDGCIDGKVLGSPIETMFGLHGWPRLPVGMISTRPGPLLAASDRFEIKVIGTGAHAAWPHLGTDPLVAATAIVNALQTIASRSIDPLDPVVVSVTTIHAGTAFNVIPSQADIGGTVRTLTPAVQEKVRARLAEISTSVAQAHGCEAKMTYHVGYPVTLNDPTQTETVLSTARDAFGDNRVETMQRPVMGGEDFSYFCQKIPSCFFVLGLIPEGESAMPDLHQPTFNFNDDAMATGIEMFCRLALGS